MTSWTAPNSKTASVTIAIHAVKALTASTAGAYLAPVRTCHHIAIDAARKAPAAYEAIRSGPMSWSTSIAPTSTNATNASGHA